MGDGLEGGDAVKRGGLARELGRQLGTTDGVIGLVATALAALRRVARLESGSLALHDHRGQLVALVDDARTRTDAQRSQLLETGWLSDPILSAACSRLEPIATQDTIVVPLLSPGGLVATLRCELAEPWTLMIERTIVAIGMAVAARLWQLGVTPSMLGSDDVLTRRQLDIARLARVGLRTSQIAAELRISANTVKKHLGDVFERLGVNNRVELARALQVQAGALDFPIGVTHHDGVVAVRRRPSAPVAGVQAPQPV